MTETQNKGYAIVKINAAIIENLIASGSLSVDGLSNPSTAKVQRMWLRDSISPSGEVHVVIEGSGLHHVYLGGEIPCAKLSVVDKVKPPSVYDELITELRHFIRHGEYFFDDGYICVKREIMEHRHVFRYDISDIHTQDDIHAYAGRIATKCHDERDEIVKQWINNRMKS